MIDRIVLEGDQTESSKWVGWAKSEARALANRSRALVGGGRTVTHHTKPIPDVDVFIRVQRDIAFIKISSGQNGFYCLLDNPINGFFYYSVNTETLDVSIVKAVRKKGGLKKLLDDETENLEEFPYQAFHEIDYKITGFIEEKPAYGYSTFVLPKKNELLKLIESAYLSGDILLIKNVYHSIAMFFRYDGIALYTRLITGAVNFRKIITEEGLVKYYAIHDRGLSVEVPWSDPDTSTEGVASILTGIRFIAVDINYLIDNLPEYVKGQTFNDVVKDIDVVFESVDVSTTDQYSYQSPEYFQDQQTTYQKAGPSKSWTASDNNELYGNIEILVRTSQMVVFDPVFSMYGPLIEIINIDYNGQTFSVSQRHPGTATAVSGLPADYNPISIDCNFTYKGNQYHASVITASGSFLTSVNRGFASNPPSPIFDFPEPDFYENDAPEFGISGIGESSGFYLYDDFFGISYINRNLQSVKVIHSDETIIEEESGSASGISVRFLPWDRRLSAFMYDQALVLGGPTVMYPYPGSSGAWLFWINDFIYESFRSLSDAETKVYTDIPGFIIKRHSNNYIRKECNYTASRCNSISVTGKNFRSYVFFKKNNAVLSSGLCFYEFNAKQLLINNLMTRSALDFIDGTTSLSLMIIET
jgi:hypothetical protein